MQTPENATYWSRVFSDAFRDSWDSVIEHTGEAIVALILVAILIHLYKHGWQRPHMKKALKDFFISLAMTSCVFTIFFMIHVLVLTPKKLYSEVEDKLSKTNSFITQLTNHIAGLALSNQKLQQQLAETNQARPLKLDLSGINQAKLVLESTNIVSSDNKSFCMELRLKVSNGQRVGEVKLTAESISGKPTISEWHAVRAESQGNQMFRTPQSKCDMTFLNEDPYHVYLKIWVSEPSILKLSGPALENEMTFAIGNTDK